MSTKLTLTMEYEIIQKAKSYANINGISLSKMVEQYFKGITSNIPSDKDTIPPITKELSGYAKITTAKSDKELLVAALEKKYL